MGFTQVMTPRIPRNVVGCRTQLLGCGQPPNRNNDSMQKISLAALARRQVDRAPGAGAGHTADTVYGGHEKVLLRSSLVSGL
jgi:hypothetical protein